MELTLLQRVAAGQESALSECLQQYGGLVWSIASRYLPNRSDAEDVVQEIFLDLWKSAKRFNPDVASESTFVAMLTRRRVIDQQRKTQRTLKTSSLPDINEPVATETTNQFEISDEAAKARRFLDELRPEEQTVIRLAIDSGLSQTQIAEKTSWPLGTVKTHARRGMIRLRELLSGEVPVLKGEVR